MGGLQRSDLVIVAGRPGMGKTALATNIAYNIAKAYRAEVQADGTTLVLCPPWNMPTLTVERMAPEVRVFSALS